jgi:hypothetical protein
MSTVPCPDCAQPVSPRATICPHCGRPLTPSTGAAPGGGGPSRATTTLSQLNFPPTRLALTTEKVRNLTLKDLDDLVVYVKGQAVDNPAVAALQATDLKSLDDLFGDQRARALQMIASAGPGGPVNAADAPSGCCCTPCCCTAAVEIDPFQD